jgi:hypothetical protein
MMPWIGGRLQKSFGSWPISFRANVIAPRMPSSLPRLPAPPRRTKPALKLRPLVNWDAGDPAGKNARRVHVKSAMRIGRYFSAKD